MKEKTDATDGDKKSELSLSQLLGVTYFHDQYQEAHVSVPSTKIGCVKVRSKEFSRWLYGTIQQAGYAINKSILARIIDEAEGGALFGSPQFELEVRIAEHDGFIWYDLGNCKAIKISAKGWEVVSDVPILFRRFKHQKVQVEPERGGDIRELLEFVNIPGGINGLTHDQILFLAWTVFAFIPNCPHPMFVSHGSQGSGKTTAFGMLKGLIDPSQLDTLYFSESQRELVQQASHHCVLMYDNLTELSDKQSDLLCQIVTGTAVSKRELRSDDTDVLYSFKRVVGLNGINVIPTRADLLDRSLIIGFERMEKFESSKVLWVRFELAKPRIFGAILDALVKTLQVIGNIKELERFRMADFAKYGCGIATAIGLTEGDFLAAYQENLDLLNGEALAATLIGPAIVRLMEARDSWEGTATALWKALSSIALELQIDTGAKEWPKDVRWVWRRIQEITTNLVYFGISIKWHYKNDKTITITKSKKNVPNVAPDKMDIPDIPGK